MKLKYPIEHEELGFDDIKFETRKDDEVTDISNKHLSYNIYN
jgi:hypothetical protein